MTKNSGLHFCRFPDQNDHIRRVELTMNPWSDELYRRMIKNEECVPEYTLPPLDVISRENWERFRRGEHQS